MGEINIPPNEKDAIKAIDSDALNEVIEQCLRDEHPRALRALRLDGCGLHVSSKLRQYEAALTRHGNAKSIKKRDETRYDALSAGRALSDAVAEMKFRVEKEAREGQFFYIDDRIWQPSRFSELMSVNICYQWRRAVEDGWTYGSITFTHTASARPKHTFQQPQRKPSAAQQERDRQDTLCNEWMDLMRSGLYSVRDYFQAGRDGAVIPPTFQARVDPYTRRLNNFSTTFWRDRS